jgi:hypothetical protein
MLKRARWVVVAVLLVLSAGEWTWAEDLATGFAGVPWGAGLSTQPYLTAAGTKGPVSYYRDPGRVPTFEGEPVPKLAYGFFQDRFFAAYVDIDQPELFAKVRSRLQEDFGEAKRTYSVKEELSAYQWKHGEVKIKLKHWEQRGKMKVAFYYLPLSRQVNEMEQEQFQEKGLRFVPIESDKKPEVWKLFEF